MRGKWDMGTDFNYEVPLILGQNLQKIRENGGKGQNNEYFQDFLRSVRVLYARNT
jgi:hypothetical protein